MGNKPNPLIREMMYRVKKAEDDGIKFGMYTALRLVEDVLPTVEGIGPIKSKAIEDAIKQRLGELIEQIRNGGA